MDKGELLIGLEAGGWARDQYSWPLYTHMSKQKVEETITLAKRHTDTQCCKRKPSFPEQKENH